MPVWVALTALAILSPGAEKTSLAQSSSGFNPYGNSGYADYREFSVPSTSNNPALPGQARINSTPAVSRPRTSRYSTGVDDEATESTTRNGSTTKNSPRVFKANNNKANDEFVKRMKERDEAYAKALNEKDPVKRAKLLRQIEAASLSRPPAPKSSSTAPEPPGGAQGSKPRSSAPAIPGSTNNANRTTAPPPVSGSASGSAAPSPSASGVTPPPPISSETTTKPRSSGRPALGPPPSPSSIATPGN